MDRIQGNPNYRNFGTLPSRKKEDTLDTEWIAEICLKNLISPPQPNLDIKTLISQGVNDGHLVTPNGKFRYQ
jgi:hypothetical protein